MKLKSEETFSYQQLQKDPLGQLDMQSIQLSK